MTGTFIKMNKTKIEWTELSWNPITGCNHGCQFCYARKLSHRFGRSFEPEFHPDRLNQPFQIKKPHMIFVCSMGELFGDWVPDSWRERVLDVIRQNPQHTFQLLTKSPENLYKFNPWPANAWAGASAINAPMAKRALDGLTKTYARIKFISAEPLLGDLGNQDFQSLSWIIIGAQTNPSKQPQQVWVENILGQSNNIPIFMKPNLIWTNPLKQYPNEFYRQHNTSDEEKTVNLF